MSSNETEKRRVCMSREALVADKDRFSKVIIDCREQIESGKFDHCACPELRCEWHGNCKECVIVHRAYQDHIPNCLKSILRNKINALSATIECDVVSRERTPEEYWDYLEENYPKE